MIAIGLVAKVARAIIGSQSEPDAAASTAGAAVDVRLLLIQVPLVVLPSILPETLVGLDGDDDDAYADDDDLIASNRLS